MKSKSQTRATPSEPTAARLDRRRQIEEVAVRAFCELGYGGASMRDIARAMETTQAALYYHFSGKEEILYSIIERFTEDLLALVRERFESSEDPVEGLRRAMLAHILVQESRGLETRVALEEKRNLGAAARRRMVGRQKAIFGLYRERVAALIASGRGRALDPSVATFALFGAINNFLYWFQPGGRLSLQLAAQQTVALVLDGLLLPTARRKAPPRRSK